MASLHLFTCVAAGALSLGAAGRWGAVDLGRFFVFDRCLIAVLWLGLLVSPAFLYPLLLACCCLQYTVSGFPLNPGYSNLLGFEFMRSSLCMVLAGLLVHACMRLSAVNGAFFGVAVIALEDIGAQAPALVLCGQGAGYVQQAVAKCALGKHWYSWVLENRLQCLAVNAYLRGWGSPWLRMEWVLRTARLMSRVRVPLCAAVCLMELGWLFILSDRRLALAILTAAAAFHLAVWLLTGLAGYHYAISHGLMIIWVVSPAASAGFTPEHAWTGACCILASSVWVLLLRRNLFREYSRSGNPGGLGRMADPADHLMSWWDGPYMRLYSYSVKTASGKRFRFPVTRFSPYDTFLTDIHTHLMILGRDWELDRRLEADRAVVRTGVWGLSVSLADRDRLYAMMDDPMADLDVLNPIEVASAPDAGGIRDRHPSPRAGETLTAFFQGLNRYHSLWWFRILIRWPHFPGEDHVPDWSPLSRDPLTRENLPCYPGSEPVTEVTCHCVKTFYRGNDIHVVEDRVFARLQIPSGYKEGPTS